jgi:hypothetical protein
MDIHYCRLYYFLKRVKVYPSGEKSDHLLTEDQGCTNAGLQGTAEQGLESSGGSCSN